MLTPDNSLRYGDGTVYDNRKEDIRFSCSAVSCELESDTVVFTRVYGDPGDGTHDMCDLMTANTKTRRVPTAAIAAGTEICVRDQDGNVGLVVVETKSTAIPKIGFLRVDLTVWRKT
ncbi:hypothetical protein [Streptomyces sp. NPDC054826]